MRGNHVLKVTAHANAPINAHPNFRQYDFFVDGMSFFSMPKVYRLGLTDSAPIYESGALAIAQSSRVPGSYAGQGVGGDSYGARTHSAPAQKKSLIAEIETPHNADEEEAYLKEAIKQSLSETENKEKDIQYNSNNSLNAEPPASSGPDLLIDFMSEPGPAPAPAPISHDSFGSALVQQNNQFSPYAVQHQPAPVQGQVVPQPPLGQMHGAPPPFTAVDPFAPPAATIPATPMSTVSSVASSFTNPPPAVVPGFNNSASSFPPAAPAAAPPAVPIPEQAPAEVVQPANLTMNPKDTGLGSDANDAFQKFANMDQFDLVKPKVQAENPFDAPVVPTNAPPPAPTTLADMKAMNDTSSERKEVMKPNAMVVSGAQSGNWGVTPNTYVMGQAPVMGQMGQAPAMGGQPMMNQGYGYQQQQQPMQQQQNPPMQQQPAYGQPQYQQQGYGQAQQF